MLLLENLWHTARDRKWRGHQSRHMLSHPFVAWSHHIVSDYRTFLYSVLIRFPHISTGVIGNLLDHLLRSTPIYISSPWQPFVVVVGVIQPTKTMRCDASIASSPRTQAQATNLRPTGCRQCIPTVTVTLGIIYILFANIRTYRR